MADINPSGHAWDGKIRPIRPTGPSAEIRIDKGIPIPADRRLRSGKTGPKRYPWLRMEVGDSFLWPWADDVRRTQALACGAAGNRHVNTKERYTVRQLVEKGVTVVRVWRIA